MADEFQQFFASKADVVVPAIERQGALSATEVLATRDWWAQRQEGETPPPCTCMSPRPQVMTFDAAQGHSAPCLYGRWLVERWRAAQGGE